MYLTVWLAAAVLEINKAGFSHCKLWLVLLHYGIVLYCVLPLKDYLDAMVGVCYDGVEGVLYLCLFSSLAACAFTVMLCAIPRAWRQIACR